MAVLKRQTLQKICTAFMCFFSLFSCATAALAWFWQNRELGGHGDVEPYTDDIHARFFVYKYDKNNRGSDHETPVSGEAAVKYTITDFTLNTYDTIFIDQNKYTPALIRIHLSGTAIEDASASNPKSLEIKIARDTSFAPTNQTELDKGEYYYKCISNVANFTASIPSASEYEAYTQNDNLDDLADVEEFFDDTVAAFKEDDENVGETFFDIEPSEVEGEDDVLVDKYDYVTLNVTYTSTSKVNGVNHVMVYLYVDYNRFLLQSFTKADEGNDDIFSQIDTTLVNDLSYIEVNLPGDSSNA